MIAAVQRATDPDNDPTTDDAVDVINMSLGGPGDPNEPLALAVDAAVDQGVVVVVAAGNNGPSYETVYSPGVARKALTVGAANKSDAIADLSSRGPVEDFYEWIKPDILAPGVDISSTAPITGSLGDPSRYQRLDGTSMSAPHIAGAAALIKQLHPSWSPEMIKANLMNTAKDLGLNVYTQGAGRVQVNDAVSAQAVLTPGSVSFGLVNAEQPVWTKIATLQLTNVTTTSLQWSLHVSDTLPAGVTTRLNPADVTLAAGQRVTVTFAITVDNSLTPFQDQEPGSYEGQVTVRSGTPGQVKVQSADKALVVPFAFIKRTQLDIAFDENPSFVFVHNGERLWEKQTPENPLKLLVRPGTYDVIVIYKEWLGNPATWVVREGVAVSGLTRLKIQRNEASHTITISPRDKKGQPISAGYERQVEQFTHIPSGISIDMSQRGNILLRRNYSHVSANYAWDWRLDVDWGGAYYLFHDRVVGIHEDLTYQNAPDDLWRLRHQCHPSPAHPQVRLIFQYPYF